VRGAKVFSRLLLAPFSHLAQPILIMMGGAKMIFSRFAAYSLAALIATSQIASAAPPGTVTGGVIVPVIDGNPTSCIDVTKQQVSMFIAGLKAQRYSSWFSDSKQVGVKVDVQIRNPGASNPVYDFPTALSLTPIGTGDVLTLPIGDYPVMSKFSFTDDKNNAYANVGLTFTFIDVTGASNIASTMTSLINFSTSLSIPPNPYTEGVQDFGKFVSMLSTSETDDKNAQVLAAKNNDLYDGTGQCLPNELHEGTYAILYDFVPNSGLFVHHGNPPPGTLPVSSIILPDHVGPTGAAQTKYCFYLNGGNVTYAQLGNAADCQHVTGTAQPLGNPQVVVEAIAYDRPTKAAGNQVVASIGNVPSSNLSAAMAANTTPAVNALVPLGASTAASRLHQSLTAGRTLADSVRDLGASPVNGAKPGTFAMDQDVHLAIANARAIARCQKIGVPANKLAKLCTVASLNPR
jgi:hypothetical protein